MRLDFNGFPLLLLLGQFEEDGEEVVGGGEAVGLEGEVVEGFVAFYLGTWVSNLVARAIRSSQPRICSSWVMTVMASGLFVAISCWKIVFPSCPPR